MITTTYNFKQWFKRHYPDITISPVYGLEAYTISAPMSPEHMFEYNVQQLPSGLYIVFIGKSPEQVLELMRDISANGLMYHKPKKVIPTTFSSFENWYREHQLQLLHRTHVTKMTAAEALHDDTLEKVKRDWYLYEFRRDQVWDQFIGDIRGPYVETESGTIVLAIKSPVSAYVSKRQLFLQKFALMQPLFEQLVAACAKGDWEKATEVCAQYASIQFDAPLKVGEPEHLKMAFQNNELSLYTRCKANFNLVDEAENDF